MAVPLVVVVASTWAAAEADTWAAAAESTSAGAAANTWVAVAAVAAGKLATPSDPSD